MLDGDTSFLEKCFGELIGILISDYDTLHTGVYDHLGAECTGIGSGIECGGFGSDTVKCTLEEDIHFRVKPTAEFVPFAWGDAGLFSEASYFEAVFETCRSAVVASGEYALASDQYGSDLPAETGRPASHFTGDGHKVFIPGRTRMSHLMPTSACLFISWYIRA